MLVELFRALVELAAQALLQLNGSGCQVELRVQFALGLLVRAAARIDRSLELHCLES